MSQLWRSRWGFDFVSRYKHKPIPEGSTLSLEELRAQGYTMNDSQWLAVRFHLFCSCPCSVVNLCQRADHIMSDHFYRESCFSNP